MHGAMINAATRRDLMDVVLNFKSSCHNSSMDCTLSTLIFTRLGLSIRDCCVGIRVIMPGSAGGLVQENGII